MKLAVAAILTASVRHPPRYESALMRKILFAVFCLSLAGCEAVPPTIVDLQQDKVVIAPGDGNLMAVFVEAQRGCALHGRSAVPVSIYQEPDSTSVGYVTQQVPAYYGASYTVSKTVPVYSYAEGGTFHLFACVP